MLTNPKGVSGLKASNLGNFFEDFIVGDILEHNLSKTIFESDNNLFCLLTMNHHPIHLNQHYAEQSQHKGILVVGTLVFSLVVGMTVPDISGQAIANLNYENIDHLGPVRIGDTLYAKTKILSARPCSTKSDRGVVCVETTGYNQNNEEVIRFKRSVLVKRRESGA
jgi:acyl dehydratase